ncbi:hypothetical protein P3X46_015663 [Hevea brasiliensis]|uniref:glutathione transferase n=2 Tax=Hevea brasiliensis TaxID=3981 RepID=A0ABQ9LYW4_HEVBR|nr:hypothetical protein P3X46_015663 [Hevea brasiliensis]
MAEEEVKLIGMWASPFNCRIRLALKLKGIVYEYIEEDFSNKSSLLLEYNPVHKKIPVLVHNGKPIAESLVILEYIDETWKNNPILPENPNDRAIARFWAKFVDEKILQSAVQTKGKQVINQQNEELDQNLKLLEKVLKGQEFFGGESIGYLDIVAFAVLYWFQVSREVRQTDFISENKFPFLSKWIGKMSEIDAVKQSLPPRGEHLAFYRGRIEGLKSASN